jgi:hypothetical protein
VKRPAPRKLRHLLLAFIAALAAAGCDLDKHCGSDGDCDDDQQACRPEVDRCPGTAVLVTFPGGHCRYKGSTCSSDLDCVPLETCGQDGVCLPTPPPCAVQLSCPPECPFQTPFPCACVCVACPAAPDGGA